MKWLLIFIVSLSACGPSDSHPSFSSTVYLQNAQLGEYLKVESESSVLTFNREGTQRGLVRVHWPHGRMEVVDREASEGKDLQVSQGHIAYRLDRQLVILRNGLREILPVEIEKLQGMYWPRHSEALLFVQATNKSTQIVHLAKDGKFLGSILTDYSFRAYCDDQTGAFAKDSQIQFVNYLSLLDEVDAEVSKAPASDYVACVPRDNSYDLFFLNEKLGTLQFLRAHAKRIETVDGEANKSYMGMDLAAFEDGTESSAFYLDARELRLKLARKINGVWKAWNLPMEGATGFYTQILKLKNDELTLATHNYRTDWSAGKSSFDDLVFITFRLNEFR